MKVVLVIVLGIIVSDLAGKVVRQESQEYRQYDEDYEPLIIVDVVESGGQVSRLQEGIKETADAGSFTSLYVDSVLILNSGRPQCRECERRFNNCQTIPCAKYR